jgi:hypothetical protein
MQEYYSIHCRFVGKFEAARHPKREEKKVKQVPIGDRD